MLWNAVSLFLVSHEMNEVGSSLSFEQYFGLEKMMIFSDKLYQLWLAQLNGVYKAHKFIFSLACYI